MLGNLRGTLRDRRSGNALTIALEEVVNTPRWQYNGMQSTSTAGKLGFIVQFKIPSVMHIWETEEGNQSMVEKLVCPAHVFLYIMSLFVNFWFQVLLVSQNVPVPFGDGLLFTHPNFLSHLERDGKAIHHTIQITDIYSNVKTNKTQELIYLLALKIYLLNKSEVVAN